MFEYLYNTLFPLLGRFFGGISSVAMAKTSDMIDFLIPTFFDSGLRSLDCVNIFNGQVFSIFSLSGIDNSALNVVFKTFGTVIHAIFSGISNLFGLADVPFVFALLVLFSTFFVSIAIFRFTLHLFK